MAQHTNGNSNRSVFKTVQNFVKLQMRSLFLTQCLQFKVVPETLKSKPPRSQSSQFSSTQNNYKNLAISTSLKNLRFAQKDAKMALAAEEVSFDTFLRSNSNNLSFIKSSKSKITKKLKLHYKKRLNFLKVKNNIPIETETRIPGLDIPKPKKNRRFHKRSQYNKWKRKEAGRKIESIVFNLSDIPLTTAMEKVLNRGLSFAPTPEKLDITLLKSDLAKHSRKILWKYELFGKDIQVDPNAVKDVFKTNKANFPRTKTPAPLKAFLNSTVSDTLGSCKRRHDKRAKSNLSPKELAAIQFLKKKQSEGIITIKAVDKGGGICIMLREDYELEMYEQLKAIFTHSDGTKSPFYEPTTQKALNKMRQKMSALIKTGVSQGIISSSDAKTMEPTGQPACLYGNPKMHKGIKENRRIPPCRPIVSNSGSNSEQLSAFIDIQSKHLVKELDSYVEDTPDFLRILQGENQRGPQMTDSFPVTIDVTALYTNIPTDGQDGGVEAFKEALNRRSTDLKGKVPTDYLIEMLGLVLNGNIFEFNGELWHQKIGTAMGTKVAPTYACLFMGSLENKILQAWKGPAPYLWRRYIDDIFFIWRASVEDLEAFIEFINDQHPYIKFTATYDTTTKTIPFLDMSVSINDDGLLETDLFKKETAKVQYLLRASCHPGHITKNIPYSLLYTVKRICSKDEDFKIRREQLRQNLLSRSYPPKIIDDAFKRVSEIDRLEAIKRVKKTKEDTTVLVTTFHPLMPSVSNIIKKHWRVMVENSPEMKTVFKKPSIVAYKRPKNLQDILVRSKLPPKRPNRVNPGFGKCDSDICTTHAFAPMGITKKHVCNYTNTSYNIRSSINCKTKNVIYKITCEKCPTFVYIGETERSFHDRFSEHRRDAENQDPKKPCGIHFSKPGHSVQDIQAIAFEKVFRKDQPIFRKERESYWINKYQAIEHGANSRC